MYSVEQIKAKKKKQKRKGRGRKEAKWEGGRKEKKMGKKDRIRLYYLNAQNVYQLRNIASFSIFN